jgi:hypothetical protein
MKFKNRLRYVLAASALFTAASVSPVSAAVTWVVSLSDSLYDSSSSLYTDIKSITIGALDSDQNNLYAIIYPRSASYVNFILGSDGGALSLDTNGDSVDDYVMYAPQQSLSYSSSRSSLVVYGTSSASTGCYSYWAMTSAYDGYSVVIPWRCLGAPPSFRLEGWLSNSYSYDFLTYNETLTPIFTSAPVTQPTVTAPAIVTTPPVTEPPTTLPTTTLPPVTAPPVTAPPVTAPPRPGFIDDWIEFLVVKQPVTLQDLLLTTDCCFARGGARSMKVSPSSKNTCKARGRQLFPLKPGICRVAVSSGSGKNKLTETLKLQVKRSV